MSFWVHAYCNDSVASRDPVPSGREVEIIEEFEV
jgi:hypothetical protein